MIVTFKSLDLRSATPAKLSKAMRAATFAVAENVLSDCTPYVPIRTGRLRESGETRHGSSGDASVVWGTDADTARYARKQYYGYYSHTTQFNPSNSTGTRAWFDKVRPKREDAWREMFRREYERGII